MPFPDGLPTKLVHLTVASPASGKPATGSVRLSPNVPAVVVDDIPVQWTGGGTYEFDSQGRLVDGETVGVRLLDDSAPGTNPSGWLWQAIVSVNGSQPRPFYFTLAGAPDEVDLAKLQQLDPDVPDYVAVPGPRGPAGADGAPGADGTPGAAGASAYQVAQSNGFSGTQTQWLASLVGPAGADAPARPTMFPTDGIPDDTTGTDGDMALDFGARRIYGPKAGGAWTPWSNIPAPTATGWTRNGFAALTGADLYLTHAADGFGSGTSWRTALEPSDGLDVTFQCEMSGGTGADGICFALADPATADTFQGAGGDDLGLAGCDAVALALDTGAGSRARIVTAAAAGGGLTAVATYGGTLNLRAAPFTVRIRYAAGVLTSWIDGVQIATATIAIPASVRLGWTGANGGSTDNHIVRNVTFEPRGGIQL